VTPLFNSSEEARNEVTESVISEAFAGWAVDRLERADLRSDMRTMQALTGFSSMC
jgi:hypothetical protein